MAKASTVFFHSANKLGIIDKPQNRIHLFDLTYVQTAEGAAPNALLKNFPTTAEALAINSVAPYLALKGDLLSNLESSEKNGMKKNIQISKKTIVLR